MPENGVDLEYIVSFPSGTRVVSNSDKADDQGSTYLWNLSNSNPTEIKLQPRSGINCSSISPCSWSSSS